jgi:hypothetical protein
LRSLLKEIASNEWTSTTVCYTVAGHFFHASTTTFGQTSE